jgi:hypothetical protein
MLLLTYRDKLLKDLRGAREHTIQIQAIADFLNKYKKLNIWSIANIERSLNNSANIDFMC